MHYEGFVKSLDALSEAFYNEAYDIKFNTNLAHRELPVKLEALYKKLEIWDKFKYK